MMRNSKNKGRAKGGRLLRVPPPEPERILLWFTLLEMHFESASITDDKLKFNTLVANLGYKYLKQVTDVVFDPPATGRYEKLKSEVIKKLADSNDTTVWKLLEGEKIEDRTPSQFYRDMKRLASTVVFDDLVLMLWKTRLPLSIQRALDVVKEMDENVLTEMADRIHRLETGQIAAVSAEQTTEVSKQSNRASDSLHDWLSRLEAQTSALALESRSRSRSEHRRLGSEERSQQPDLCKCHGTHSDCANKCYYPCDENQDQGNATRPSKFTTYVDHGWGLIYVNDTCSEFSFLVDTGAARCTFPRQKIPGYANRPKDEHYHMIAANGTRIDTYGPIPVYLSLGGKWRFKWVFTVADVISPVIGMDFLQHHGFLVDTRNKCLFKPAEPSYEILCHGCHWGLDVPHKPNPSTNTTNISNLTNSSVFELKKFPHDAEHHSGARFGPLAHIKPRCADVNTLKRKCKIQGDDGTRATSPFKLDGYIRFDCRQDDEH